MNTTQTPDNPNLDTEQGHEIRTGSSFHHRLEKATGGCSYRKLGKLTDTHPETVRRYMNGQSPSATFLTNLCRALGISGEWLLTGRGPMKCKEMKSHALSQADPSELMSAVANTLTDLCDRMDRLERFVQELDTRIRGTQSRVMSSVSTQERTIQDNKLVGSHDSGESVRIDDQASDVGKMIELKGDVSDGSGEANIKDPELPNGELGKHGFGKAKPLRDGSSPRTSADRIGDALSKRPS